MKRVVVRSIIFLLLVPGSVLLVFLLVTMVADFRPAPVTQLEIEPGTYPGRPISDTLTFLTWNIGYAGLGREMDFFYDGGKQVRPDRIVYERYRDGILNELASVANIDFILLQEVDYDSRRSYHDNQFELLKESLPGYFAVKATNYKVPFVPVPPLEPMGKVSSGLVTLSRWPLSEASRISLESSYSWPKSLFMPDRCFIISRFPIDNQRQLVVINTHNSAFDDGEMRRYQMEQLREAMVEEYEKGNVVVAGGDWNLNPPGFLTYKVTTGDVVYDIEPGFPNDFFPEGWFWAHDRVVPSNRFLVESYMKSRTPTTTIDFFIMSPYLRYTKIETLDLGFENSDHNPVIMQVVIPRPTPSKSTPE